jgi:hypothetical protein
VVLLASEDFILAQASGRLNEVGPDPTTFRAKDVRDIITAERQMVTTRTGSARS